MMNTSNALLVAHQVTPIARLNAAVIISIVSMLVHKEWVYLTGMLLFNKLIVATHTGLLKSMTLSQSPSVTVKMTHLTHSRIDPTPEPTSTVPTTEGPTTTTTLSQEQCEDLCLDQYFECTAACSPSDSNCQSECSRNHFDCFNSCAPE